MCWRSMNNLRSALPQIPSVMLGFTAVAASALCVPEAAAQGAGETRGQGSEHVAKWFDTGLHWTVRAIEVVGIATIVIGAVAATAMYLYRTIQKGPKEAAYHNFRSSLGRSILLGLEFLVAADIINTVAIDPTLQSVAVLAAVVAVRTFLSFALEVEIDGEWPWRKHKKKSDSV